MVIVGKTMRKRYDNVISYDVSMKFHTHVRRRFSRVTAATVRARHRSVCVNFDRNRVVTRRAQGQRGKMRP